MMKMMKMMKMLPLNDMCAELRFLILASSGILVFFEN